MSRKKREQGESSTLALVICSEDDKDVLDANHQSHGPDDEREGSEKVLVRGIGAEGRRVDVKRTGSNIAIDDASGLVREPGRRLSKKTCFYERHGAAYHQRYHPEKTCRILAVTNNNKIGLELLTCFL